MRNLGPLWQRCHNGDIILGEWEYQRRLTIDGVVYNDDYIVNLSHDKGLLYDAFSFGNCICGTIQASVLSPPGVSGINSSGNVLLEVRVVTLNDGESDWFEFGHYETVKAEKKADRWIIEGLDSMNKLEEQFINFNPPSYPTPCINAINHISSFLGIQVDPRSPIDNNITIGDPKEMTMREALSYIGGLHGGNWYITEENKLRLVIPLISNITNVIDPSNYKGIIEVEPLTFDKIIMRHGMYPEDKFIAGEGYNTLETYNPWATQYSANKVHSMLADFVYYPYDAKSTVIDPATELGDTLEVNGKLVSMWQVSYSLRMYAYVTLPSRIGKDMDRYQIRLDNHEYRLDDHETRIEDLENVEEGCELINEINSRVAGSSIIEYYGDSKCIIIPKSINGVDIKSANFFLSRNNVVEKVISKDNLINSMRSMFAYSESNMLDLSELDTYNVIDMRNMFQYSSSEVMKLNFNTINVNNMSGMFDESSVNSLNLGSFNTSKVLDMSKMFRACAAEYINIHSFDTSKVLSMYGMFSGCMATSIGLTNFNTESVENMGYMFKGSYAEILNLSSFNTSNVINMEYMFNSSKASIINTRSFNTSNVTNMKGMFKNSVVMNIDLFNFDTSKVIDMSEMFYGIKGDIVGIENINVENVTDFSGIFSNIDNINQELDLSNFNSIYNSSLSGSFRNSKLKKIILPQISGTELGMQWNNDLSVEILDISNCPIQDPPHIPNGPSGPSPVNIKTIYVNSSEQKDIILSRSAVSEDDFYSKFVIV